MAGRDVMHDIVRDALAMRLGGETEVCVGLTNDRLDIVVAGCDERPDLLIEVKPARELGRAIGQINSYAVRWPRPCLKQIHLFDGRNGLSPAGQRRRTEEHRRSGELADIAVTVEPPGPDLRIGDCYEIAGVKFGLVAPSQAIADHVAGIASDYLMAEYLSPVHRQFLMELAGAWMHPRSCSGVSVVEGSTPTGLPAMVVLVHGAMSSPIPLPIDDAIRAWLRLQRYRWLAVPAFPTPVGVSR